MPDDVALPGTLAGFAAAAAEAHRRRASALRTAAAAVAVVAVSLSGTARVLERAAPSDELVVSTTPERDDPPATRGHRAPATGVRGGGPGGAGPASTAGPGGPAGNAAGGPDGSGAAGPSGAGGGSDTAPAGPVAVPDRGGAGRTLPPQSQPLKRGTSRSFLPSCDVGDTARACAGAATPFKLGHYYVVAGSFCPDPSVVTTTLWFDTTVDVEFTVTDTAGVVRWSSLRDHPARAGRHKVDVAKPDCAKWETRWTARGNDDTRLPAGTYTLRMLVRSTGAAGASVGAAEFTLP